jgi:dihydroorotate dehydrogenase
MLEYPGIDAISMSPQRGCLLDAQNNLVSGRLYGPALFPHTIAAVESLLDTDIPVIAGGGVYHTQNINILLEMGVKAVQLDTVLWRGGTNISNIT